MKEVLKKPCAKNEGGEGDGAVDRDDFWASGRLVAMSL